MGAKNLKLSNQARFSVFAMVGILGAGLGSCNFYQKKQASNQSSFPSDQTPWFQIIQREVLIPNCLGCHSAATGNAGGVNLETYSSAKSFAAEIKVEVSENQSMPPSGPLDVSLRDLVSRWVDAGAPETEAEANATIPKTEPSPVSLITSVDYQVIKEKVIDPSCLKCHGPNSRLMRLHTYEDLKARIVEVQEAIEIGSMPPAGPLAQDLRDLLKEWITAGLPESLNPTPTITPSPAVSPTPTPTLAISPVTYEMVKAQIFTPSCVRCHGAAGGVSLETYGAVVQNIDKIRNAVIVDSTMPPRKPLSADLKSLLQSWIDGGLLEK